MYIIILNPNSGMGRALEKLPEIEKVMQKRGLEYRIQQDHAAGDTCRVVADAIANEKPEGIIAVGGDGTLIGVVNGMQGSDVPLIFIPCGTGNDFVRMLKLPKDPVEALKAQLDAEPSRIDVGLVETQDGSSTRFLNVSGTGFDVVVLSRVDKYKEKYSGLKPYLYALVESIRHYKPVTAMVSYDGEAEQECSFAIISVGNGRYFGGGMDAVPGAAVNDGLFDVVTIIPVKKAFILPLVLFFVAGKHIVLRLAKVRRCRSVSIRLKKGSGVFNLDGELVSASAVKYSIIPGALAVQIPGLK